MQLKSINGHRFYPNFNRNSIIVDLGAHKGNFSKKFIQNSPYNQIILIEANPDLISIIDKKLANFKNYQILNRAIDNQPDQTINFYPSHNPLAGSTNRELRDQFDQKFEKQLKNPTKVKTITLDELIQTYGEIDLLKIDIEGLEWNILENLTQYHFEKINQISVEFHDFINPDWRSITQRVIEKLEQLGYSRFSFEGKPKGRFYSEYMDTLFYKK
jgi:FkbM family methyltransferase